MFRILAVLLGIFITQLASAQNTPLACQVDASAGLSWDSGRWRTSRFVERKFILVMRGNTLTKESVAEALRFKNPSRVSCKTDDFDMLITCVAGGERTLIFQPKNNSGGTSSLFGTAMASSEDRDTVSVEAFTCQQY